MDRESGLEHRPIEVLTAGHVAFKAGTDFEHVFCESSTSALVGGSGAHRRVGPGAAETGYWIRSDRHNRGYPTTAAAALTDVVFNCLADVEQVEIHMDCANVASARIPDKLGYRLLHTEQHPKRALAHTGQAFVWQTTRADWTPPANNLALGRRITDTTLVRPPFNRPAHTHRAIIPAERAPSRARLPAYCAHDPPDIGREAHARLRGSITTRL